MCGISLSIHLNAQMFCFIIKLLSALLCFKMQNLKVLNWYPMMKNGSWQVKTLKNGLPELSINNEPKGIKIASSSQSFDWDSGFWEIEAKRLPLFRKNYWK